MDLNGFKAYDIRGKIGKEITDEIVYRIGRAMAVYLQAKTIVLGCDIRLTSEKFKHKLSQGINDQGVDVIDLGVTGTEEIYFATSYLGVDGGVEITASHNPKDYNGLKIVGKDSIPLGLDSGLDQIRDLVAANKFPEIERKGSIKYLNLEDAYTNKLLSFINLDALKDLQFKVLFNIGNGTAGKITKLLVEKIQRVAPGFKAEYLYFEPDGNFPHGIPNPLLVNNRQDTIEAIKKSKADIGVAFDGDFDRCFFFDHEGEFITGYNIVGLLAKAFLAKNSGAKIVYEPRLIWNTEQIVKQAGGQAIISKSGHSFIKQKLRQVDALYGGELSAHHYFKDYYYCDSGMIPWLLIVELLAKSNENIQQLVAKMKTNFPHIDETNFTVADPQAVFARVREFYKNSGAKVSTIDGLSYEFADWRFNIRMSNTEPLVRLNLESRGDASLLQPKTEELSKLIY